MAGMNLTLKIWRQAGPDETNRPAGVALGQLPQQLHRLAVTVFRPDRLVTFQPAAHDATQRTQRLDLFRASPFTTFGVKVQNGRPGQFRVGHDVAVQVLLAAERITFDRFGLRSGGGRADYTKTQPREWSLGTRMPSHLYSASRDRFWPNQ